MRYKINFIIKVFYEEAIRLHPKYAKAYDNLGAIFDDGTPDGMDKAEQMYKKAIGINPHHPSPYCNLAGLQTLQERFPEAVATLLAVRNYDKYYYSATVKLAQIMHKREGYQYSFGAEKFIFCCFSGGI